jgi:hypothetical protein
VPNIESLPGRFLKTSLFGLKPYAASSSKHDFSSKYCGMLPTQSWQEGSTFVMPQKGVSQKATNKKQSLEISYCEMMMRQRHDSAS